MNLKLPVILICSFISNLFNLNPVLAQPLELGVENWKFQQGDSLTWATPQYNDASWQDIVVGKSWESALGINFDGIAWYRKTIVVPSISKRQAKKSGSMVLKIGAIDDADETYFNGVKIGATGKFPPISESAWDIHRAYIVPYNLIRWDAPNVISVRVSDWGGGGGLYTGEYVLEATTWKDKFGLLIENSEISNAFSLGKPIQVKTQLVNNSNENLGGELTCEVKTFTGQSIALQSKLVQIPSKSKLKTEITFSFDVPNVGFYISNFTFKDKKGYAIKDRKGFAIAPEDAKIAPNRPTDFDDFWNKAKAELDTILPDYKLTILPKLSTDKIDVFELEMRSIGNIRIRGYYAQPIGKTNLPALLNVQGYSSIMQPFGLDTNVATVFLNIRGHGNSRDDLNPGFPGFLQFGLENKDTYIYRGAYMDCLRAVDFLCSRAEVDTSRVAVSGGSQGGALSIATAALDKRIKLCLPDVPFLSDFRNYFQIAAWPSNEFKDYVRKTGKTWDEVYAVLDYFDIKNMAPNITCPVVMGVGLFDETCPPAINFAAYNNLASADKSYFLYPQSGHSLPAAQHNVKMKWLYERFLIKN